MSERHSTSTQPMVRTAAAAGGTPTGVISLADVDFPRLPGAACQDVPDPDRFYALEDHHIEQARSICRRCPVIRECLTWALTHTEHGVWAATTAEERAELITRHRRSA